MKAGQEQMAARLAALEQWLESIGVPEAVSGLLVGLLALGGLLVAGWLLQHGVRRLLESVCGRIARRTRGSWDDALVDQGVLRRLAHLAPAWLMSSLGPVWLGGFPALALVVDKGVQLYIVGIVVAVLNAGLNAGLHIMAGLPRARRLPVRGFVQAVKLVMMVFAGILMLSIIFGQAPGYFLSGLGALTAVLLLIFKDAILGLVAGVQVSVNNTVQVGDWIVMPNHGADGDVIDVSLTTVKVQNWDKTITSIPSYALISESLTNWRGMTEAGGRRIKRSLNIDMQTVGFMGEDLRRTMDGIRLLAPYLERKEGELAQDRSERGLTRGQEGLNGRRLTNLGTFRAYCEAYLRSRADVRQDMTFLVRQLQPTPTGLPLEIYVFTNDTRWAVYEAIQADIFDHLLAAIPEFGLRVFQEPSGRDLRDLSAVVAPRA